VKLCTLRAGFFNAARMRFGVSTDSDVTALKHRPPKPANRMALPTLSTSPSICWYSQAPRRFEALPLRLCSVLDQHGCLVGLVAADHPDAHANLTVIRGAPALASALMRAYRLLHFVPGTAAAAASEQAHAALLAAGFDVQI
jgi:hypothetical protein